MSSIRENVSKVKQRIADAAAKAGRSPDEIRLLAVSKTKPIEFLTEGVNAGLDLFGENYVQEAVEKIAKIP
ncbi:MAG TPA: hypothetical protein VM432_08170, partial [Bdellovibrionales bacterium]|nr:hypothetical protein [Bdellovibrionales bacterium]